MKELAVLLYVTCPSEDIAVSLGKQCINEELAACVNIIPGMKSIYRWEGDIVEEQEIILIVKCSHKTKANCQKILISEHPYDTPCVMEMPVVGGNPEYLEWLQRCGVDLE